MADRTQSIDHPEDGSPHLFRRWLPAAVLLALIVAVYAFGLHRHLSLAALAEHRAQLRGFVDEHLILALLLYMASYVLIVALSIPGRRP